MLFFLNQSVQRTFTITVQLENFWCIDETLGAWSVTGVSAEEEYKKFTDLQDKSSMEAGFMWQAVTRKSGKYQMEAKVTSFVPFNKNIEIMHIEITNTSMTAKKVTPVAAIPVFWQKCRQYQGSQACYFAFAQN